MTLTIDAILTDDWHEVLHAPISPDAPIEMLETARDAILDYLEGITSLGTDGMSVTELRHVMDRIFNRLLEIVELTRSRAA